MANAPITELDFDQIKANLRAYLQGQDRFKDYNFEGSNMSVLLDVLAYNTFQNGFYTNMAVNEMFLDSAQLRASAVSHAKALNYVPRSRVSSRAKINVTLATNNAPAFVVIPAKTKFVARCGNETFSFYNEDAVTIYPVNGSYIYRGLNVYEGKYVTEYFNVTPGKRYILSNAKVDISSVHVYVKNSQGDTEEKEYRYQTTVFGQDENAKVFYVQAYNEDQYEITFGRDLFGKEPAAGNVIRVEYRITSGEEANGITSIAAAANIQGYPVTVTLASSSEGGAYAEDINSIKYFAPRALQVQDRAVTEKDYEILLKSRFPEIQAISVYGGDELNPPRYGKVVIAVDVANVDGVSENNKLTYANFIKDRAPIGIDPLIISPEFMHLEINARVYFNTKTTAATEGDIREAVLNSIMDFSEKNLSKFKATFRSSRLSGAIDDADVNILSNDLDIMAIIPLNPVLGSSTRYEVSFNNPMILDQKITVGENLTAHKPAISSSEFKYKGSTGFLMDDGEGNISVVKTKGTSFIYLKKNIGSVNYDTGRVVIRNLIVDSYTGSEIKLLGRTRVQTITPPKSRLLSIRESDIKIDIVGVN